MVVAPVISRNDPRLREWFLAERSMLEQMLLRQKERNEQLNEICMLQAAEREEVARMMEACKKRYKELDRWSTELRYVTGSLALLGCALAVYMLFDTQDVMACGCT